MGARQSGTTRNVTLENNSPIIGISDAVAQRLKNGLAAASRNEEKASLKTASNEKVNLTDKSNQEQEIPKAKEIPKKSKISGPSTYTNPLPYPPGIMYGEPTISAMEVQRQKEIELQKNDAYWRSKLSELEKTLNKTNTIMEQEYTTAIESVRKRFHNAAPIHQLPLCQDLKSQLIACYRTNRGESLNCAEEVTAFTNCVNGNRVRKIDEQNK